MEDFSVGEKLMRIFTMCRIFIMIFFKINLVQLVLFILS